MDPIFYNQTHEIDQYYYTAGYETSTYVIDRIEKTITHDWADGVYLCGITVATLLIIWLFAKRKRR